jgi:hypothetical protein
MKKLTALVLMLMLLATACKKDKDISLLGKWTMENSVMKEYQGGILVDTDTEPGNGTTVDFQSNGQVVIMAPGEPVVSMSYSLRPVSEIEIDGEIYQIKDLTASSVTLFMQDDMGSGDYYQFFVNLKR